MSNAKLDLVRTALAAFMQTFRANEFFADDIEWDFSGFRGWIEDTRYYGRDGFDAQMQRWTEPFEHWTMQVDELIDLGGDDVLATGSQHGKLKDSGAVVDMPLAQIATIRNGKVARIRMFVSHEDAYAAAGIDQSGESRAPSA